MTNTNSTHKRQHPGPAATLKQIRQLRSPTERQQTGTYYIEGLRIVQQALRAGETIEVAVIAPELCTTAASSALWLALRAAAIPTVELSATDFGRISFKENRQGIGAVVRTRLISLETVRLAPQEIWVALDRVGNAGNLGAIMRTCDAVGCPGLLLLGETADPYHPEAVRASMGALFGLKLVRTPFADFATWARQHGYAVIGASPDAALDYRTISYPTPLILLMGSERTGLAPEQQRVCTTLTRIPMTGTSDSLNLAVSTSVILYEIFHQQRQAAQVMALSTVGYV